MLNITGTQVLEITALGPARIITITINRNVLSNLGVKRDKMVDIITSTLGIFPKIGILTIDEPTSQIKLGNGELKPPTHQSKSNHIRGCDRIPHG